jgi:hypothetical protein
MFSKYYNNRWYYPQYDYYHRNYYDYRQQIINSQINNTQQSIVNFGYQQNVNQTSNNYNIR